MFEQHGDTLYAIFGRRTIAYSMSDSVSGSMQFQLRENPKALSVDALRAPGVFNGLKCRVALHFTDPMQIQGLIEGLQKVQEIMLQGKDLKKG